jgi:hypothetical protein
MTIEHFSAPKCDTDNHVVVYVIIISTTVGTKLDERDSVGNIVASQMKIIG